MAFYHTACFVFTIMIVCNAILYPSIFSSIFRHWFGGPPPKPEKEPVPEYPPHMRAGAGPRGAAGRMRPSPGGKPPMSGGAGGSGGVDPSAFMGQQSQESRGRGMMGTVLPVYAIGIFIYFGYVIYKVFLRDKPSTPSTRPSWSYSEDVSQQDGPTLQRQQQENLQRKLAAELKAANYPELKKSDKRAAEAAAAAAAVAAMGDHGSTTAPPGSNEEVDMLKKRLEETEKTMQRMMDMMNSMGVAMSQVSQHLSNDKSGPPSMFPDFSNEPHVGSDQAIDEDDMRDIDVDNLSDEEDLVIGDTMDRSSDEENDVSTARDDMDDDVERRRPKKMNIVDVEADDYHDDDDEDDDGDVDSDDESEEENIGVEDIIKRDTLRRRNVKGGDSAEAVGIEG